MNRRQFLSQVAPLSLGLGGLGLRETQLWASQNRSDAPAKRCLMLFMWGGPSHIDLFDMKPLAPAEIRGEFQPVSTNVSGIQYSEHLPQLSRHADKIALVRSMTHSDNNHSTSAHWMLTGHKHKVSAENFNARGDDFPHIGSVLTHLDPGEGELPAFVALPEVIGTTAGAITPGQGGGILGQQFDPFRINQHPSEKDFRVPNLSYPDGIDAQRMSRRMQLLKVFGATQVGLTPAEKTLFHSNHHQAVDLLTSGKAQNAFDLAREPSRVRESYGRGPFGQGLLLARRLLESGVRLVTVYWHRDMPGVDTTWDTHANNFQQLKDRLIPQIDQPVAMLLEDLKQRGLLDDTLVVWNSEFGRTPRVNRNAGRDHWGACNSIWLAGAGIRGGTVYGKSDAHAAKPESNAVTPEDLAATIYSQLGVDPETVIYDQLQRPFPIAEGQPIAGILR